MKAARFVAALLLALALSAQAAAPITFEELSVLLRIHVPDSYVIEKVTRRRLLRPFTPQQEATLRAQGASVALVQSLRDPALMLSEAEAVAFDAILEQRKKDQLAAKAAESAAPPAHVLSKEDFEVFDVPSGRPVNLSQWGGPRYEIRFFVKKAGGGGDQVAVLFEDTTRTFVAGEAGFDAGSIFSYSPQQLFPINRSTSLAVPGIGTIYPVYAAGGVALYFAHVSVEAANSVTLAVKVAQR